MVRIQALEPLAPSMERCYGLYMSILDMDGFRLQISLFAEWDDLDVLEQLVRDRRSVLAEHDARKVQVGDRVQGRSDQYDWMHGLTGVVVGLEGTTGEAVGVASVRLDRNSLLDLPGEVFRKVQNGVLRGVPKRNLRVIK